MSPDSGAAVRPPRVTEARHSSRAAVSAAAISCRPVAEEQEDDAEVVAGDHAANQMGNSRTVTKAAARTRPTGSLMRLARKQEQTAARPISRTYAWGLITRLGDREHRAPLRRPRPPGCAGRKRAAIRRQSISQPKATAVRPRAAVLTQLT
ncbi:hypothetical protein ACRAWF_39860 [Streptomyces sp. L7]